MPSHCRMRLVDRDLIRGGHYGQRSCEPHQKAEHMAAPTNAAKCEKSSCQPGADSDIAHLRRLTHVRSSFTIGSIVLQKSKVASVRILVKPENAKRSSIRLTSRATELAMSLA